MIVIQKQTKRDQVTPEHVRLNPEGALRDLFSGFVLVTNRVTSPKKRGQYNRNEEGWWQGKFTYTIQVALPDEVLPSMRDVLLSRDLGFFDEEEVGKTSLSYRPDLGDYSQIQIPKERMRDLLPYTSISGGLTEGASPLEELHVGSTIRETLDLQEGRSEGISTYMRR